MFNLLKEYILLEIKEASFQDILDQIISSNEKEDEKNPNATQKDLEANPVESDLEILKNMGKTIRNKIIKNDQKQNISGELNEKNYKQKTN
jgi:hypothetical protein